MGGTGGKLGEIGKIGGNLGNREEASGEDIWLIQKAVQAFAGGGVT